MYYWDTQSLQTEYILMLNKLKFLWHLSSLPNTSLAKEILNLQKDDRSLPSLLTECEPILEKIGITRDPTSYTKKEWKRLISKKVHQLNKESLLQQIQSSKKLDINKLFSEEYEVKPYLSEKNISKGRTFFSSRSFMLSTI